MRPPHIEAGQVTPYAHFLKHWHFQSNLPLSQIGVLKRRFIRRHSGYSPFGYTQHARVFPACAPHEALTPPPFCRARANLRPHLLLPHTSRTARSVAVLSRASGKASFPRRLLCISESSAGALLQSDFPGFLTIYFDIYIYICTFSVITP